MANDPCYLPPDGAVIILDRAPCASYATEGLAYRVGLHRHKSGRKAGKVHTVHLTRVEGGSGTYDSACRWFCARYTLA